MLSVKVFVALLFFILGISAHFLINHTRIVGTVGVIACALFFLISSDPAVKILACAAALLHLLSCVFQNWYMQNLVFGFDFAAGAALLWGYLPQFYSAGSALAFKIGFSLILVFVLLLCLFAFIMIAIPSIIFLFLRRHLFHNVNETDAQQKETVFPNGVRLVSNVCYDTELPNGYLDIYYPKDKKISSTVIYIHGGGYIWGGDKLTGNPDGGSRAPENSTMCYLAEKGYHVVSFNYALAPEYRFPSAVRQLCQGLEWLNEHAGQYDLNMNKVILGGASAGGNLAGLLANIQTNPAYAETLRVSAPLPDDVLKAVFFEGGLFDNRRFGAAHHALFDYVFYQMGRIYLRTQDLKRKKVIPSNVIDHVTPAFPPSFVSDGNTATFYNQAKEMHEKLKSFGVKTELSIFPKERAGKLVHGFEENAGEWSDKTKGRLYAFLQEVQYE